MSSPNYKVIVPSDLPIQAKIKKLKKSYPHIKEDLDEAIKILEENPMKQGFSGMAPIPRFGGNVWKIRVKCSDIKSGKSKGYRLVYYTNKETKCIYLLFIVIKKEGEQILRAGTQKALELLGLNK